MTDTCHQPILRAKSVPYARARRGKVDNEKFKRQQKVRKKWEPVNLLANQCILSSEPSFSPQTSNQLHSHYHHYGINSELPLMSILP